MESVLLHISNILLEFQHLIWKQISDLLKEGKGFVTSLQPYREGMQNHIRISCSPPFLKVYSSATLAHVAEGKWKEAPRTKL